MDVQDLVNHFGHASLPGLGAVIAAWMAWRLWRRLFRAALACIVVGVVLYVAFPGLAHQLIHDAHVIPASDRGGGPV